MVDSEHSSKPDLEEQKRQLIAADIHDDAVQVMLAADLKLEALKQTAGPEAVVLVSETQQLVREAAQRLRRLLFELAPIEPGLSLAQAFERYLQNSLDGFSWTVVDRLSGDPSPGTATLAYRIAQEAITNARKHSSATRVCVELREENDGLLVEVADNGLGFTTPCSNAGHLGLAAMRTRAEQAGGWLAIDTRPGEGTRVTFWLESRDLASERSPAEQVTLVAPAIQGADWTISPGGSNPVTRGVRATHGEAKGPRSPRERKRRR